MDVFLGVLQIATVKRLATVLILTQLLRTFSMLIIISLFGFYFFL